MRTGSRQKMSRDEPEKGVKFKITANKIELILFDTLTPISLSQLLNSEGEGHMKLKYHRDHYNLIYQFDILNE